MKRKIPLPSAKTLLLLIVAVIFTIVLTSLFAALLDRYQNIRFPSFGTIRTLGYDAYGGDIVIRNGNRTLDWGTVYAGASVNRSFFLRSRSNIPTTPTLNAGNWTFRDSQEKTITPPPVNVTMTWNLKDAVVKSNEEVYATLTMQVPSDIGFIDYLVENSVRTFSIDIQISPSGT